MSEVVDPWLADVGEDVLAAVTVRLRDAARVGARVAIAGHVSPDADAIGSVLALDEALTSLGARCMPVIGESPVRLPVGLDEAWIAARVRGSDATVDPAGVDLLVTLDAAARDRLGTVADLLDAGVDTVMIDHHAAGAPFGEVSLVAPHAAATAVIVAELLHRLEVPLTPSMATALYAGLVADTGRFGFSSTDASTMRLGAQLLDAGAAHVDLHRRMFATRSLPELSLLAVALGRLTYVHDLGLVHTHVTAEEVAAAGADGGATDALVDLVRSADVAEVSMVAKPGGDGTWRVSLRSEGAVDVASVAHRFGGGGHVRAAGFTATGTVDDVVTGVVDALSER